MAKPLLMIPGQLTEAQQDCVDKLKESLEQAETGSVVAVGIILCMHNGYASVIAGTKAAELNLGCDSLKRKILDVIEKPILKI